MKHWLALCGSLLACESTTITVTPPYDRANDVVLVVEQDGALLPGTPRFVPPGDPISLDVETERSTILEVRSFLARSGREHDLDRCGVAFEGPRPLRRQSAGAWRTAPFVPGEDPPSFAAIDEGLLPALTTANDCDVSESYCEQVVISSVGAIGSGAFRKIVRVDEDIAVALYEVIDDQELGARRMYRYDFHGLQPAADLEPSRDPAAKIVTVDSDDAAVFVLYDNGELWRIALGGQPEAWPSVPGAYEMTARGAIYVLGNGIMAQVDAQTVTNLGPIPEGLGRLRASSEAVYGVSTAGIEAFHEGAWHLEHPSAQLVLATGGFGTSGAEAAYYAGGSIFRRTDLGTWIYEESPELASLRGGILTPTIELAFGEYGAAFIRPSSRDPWCRLLTGFSQPLLSATRTSTKILIGTQSLIGESTIIELVLPE
jgi:hypothetical protein